MTKTLVFYGSDAKAAREKHKTPEADTFQVIQADAYQGERMEADEITFMDDVSSVERARIESLWGKFDNRVSHDPALVGGASQMDNDPSTNRGNLNAKTRQDDPDKVEPDQLKHSGVAKKAETNPEPGSQNPKGVGLDGVTGNPSTDRNKIAR